MTKLKSIVLLAHVYWDTFECGLSSEDGLSKIFGTGIISSVGETTHVYNDDSIKTPFDINDMLNTPYRIATLQPKFYVMDSFEQLCSAVPGIVTGLSKLLSKQLTH